MSSNYFVQSLDALSQIKSQYREHFVALNSPINLHDLFCRNGFNLNEYCQSFRPHLHKRHIYKEIENFGMDYGIWLDNAPDYITCHIYLFPNAHLYRMRPLLENCAVDFYLNELYGREVFHQLSDEKKKEAREITGRICDPQSLIAVPENAFKIELANQQMMNEIKRTSPKEWFKLFQYLYNLHIETAHANCETSATGKIPTVAEYIEQRCHISGMNHTILLIEYAEGQFLDWKWLEEKQIGSSLRRAQFLIAAIGCLSNDVFSFEKEVIKNDSDSNLVMIVKLNFPELYLKEVLVRSAEIVGDYIAEFLVLVEEIRNMSYDLLPDDSENIDVLENHLNGLERFLQASWVWQVHTKRYKSENSIFEETTLVRQTVNG